MSLRFLHQFFSFPRSVGSIVPSSSLTAKKILDVSNIQSAKVVVEWGPGTGVFTKEIINRLSPGALFICIELNEEFFRHLEPLFYGRENCHLYRGSAEKIKDILREWGYEYVDTIISALPYNSLPQSLSNKILKAATESMHEESEFISISYFKGCQSLLGKFFPNQRWKRNYWNIPPVYYVRMSL